MRRHRQLEAEIQRTLAELIGREVKDPRVGNVTITAVELAGDLSTARVFFVPFASRHDPAEVGVGLTHAGGFLRGQLGRRLGLRHAPRLAFTFDDTLDKAARLTSLIDEAVGKGGAATTEPDDEAPG
ncbi:MAG TPA: 30S ribosome-binding factor RbfA [Steroidobacteraceae bacterium]|nr:30S ribosome-binding factor RbfA [Steroidobacteraceae bacterium]